jgi:hypothetical protein
MSFVVKEEKEEAEAGVLPWEGSIDSLYYSAPRLVKRFIS